MITNSESLFELLCKKTTDAYEVGHEVNVEAEPSVVTKAR